MSGLGRRPDGEAGAASEIEAGPGLWLWLWHRERFGTLYAGAEPEPNAAMPSLHVAVPTVIACAAATVRGLRRPSSWLWLLSPATISVGVVDLGEHDVADVVVGLALGVVAHLAAAQLPPSPARPRPVPVLRLCARHPDRRWP
jgi:membrane-associated phospholipid phosphatase